MNRLLNTSIWIILLIAAVLTVITTFRGLILNDEGYIINSAQRMINGQTIYKDFPFAYTPGSSYIALINIKLFGNSLFSQRIGTLIISAITVLLIFLLSKTLTKQKKYIYLPTLAFLAWGPTHINFPWPVIHSIPIGLAACLMFITALKNQKSRYIFLAGCLTTITLLFKQNFGVGVFILCLILLFYHRELKKIQFFLTYLTGFALTMLVFIIYLIFNNSLYSFIYVMYEYTIERIIFEKSLDTPFFYSANPLTVLLKSIFYLFPFYISIVSLIIYTRRQKNLIIIPSFTLMFYLLGIRPTTDYVHLVPQLALSGLPFLTVLNAAKQLKFKILFIVLYLTFIIGGFYTAFFIGFYRWQKPLVAHTKYMPDPMIRLRVSHDNSSEIEKIKLLVSKYSKTNQDVFVYDYQPMIYYLSRKQNPTQFDLLALNRYFLNSIPQTINILKQKKVKLIITNKYFHHDTTLLAKFIKKNYHKINKSQNFYFWHINEVKK
jgi:4-amino-4-deoxy-L-arabinose transferase-like glycosyltransferase